MGFRYVAFEGDPVGAKRKVLQCRNLLRVQSTYVCMRARCNEHEIEVGMKAIDDDCKGKTFDWSVIDNITQSDEAGFHQIGYEDLRKKKPKYDEPLTLTDHLYELSWRTMYEREEADSDEWNYGHAMLGFWGGVVGIGLLNRIFTLVLSWLDRGSYGQNRPNRVMSKLRTWTRKHITTPGLFGYHCSHPLGYCTIPPRLQALTVFAYVTLNVVLSSVDYHAFHNNLSYELKSSQIYRYFADRCGFFSLVNMPILWIFAMRNDVLIWLTGWTYATYNRFHRWAARLATLEALLHGIFYTVSYLQSGKKKYNLESKRRFFWMGIISVSCMCLLCAFSVRPIRKRFYEFFLLCHIAFAALILVGVYYHLKIFLEEFIGYTWACVALWSVDRVCRVIRIASLNRIGHQSIAVYNPEAQTIKLDVPVRSWFRPKQGSYYFVYLMHGSKVWENHPFTLSSWTISSPSETTGAATRRPRPKNVNLSFIIRPQQGFTARLRDLVVMNSRNTKDQEAGATGGAVPIRRFQSPVRVLVEGPYGVPQTLRLDRYNSALLIIGGSGITVALGHLRSLLDVLETQMPIRLQRITLVWAVRDAAMFFEVFDDELGDFWRRQSSQTTSRLKLQIDLHISDPIAIMQYSASIAGDGPSSRSDPEKITCLTSTSTVPTSTPKGKRYAELPPHVNVIYKRPPIQNIIESEASLCSDKGHSLAIVACGPSRMVDDTRAAVVAEMHNGHDCITFFPEQM
ncbi:hypothetical protein DV738_g3482, partial [Chaetothyriales sp. CBS 135597]